MTGTVDLTCRNTLKKPLQLRHFILTVKFFADVLGYLIFSKRSSSCFQREIRFSKSILALKIKIV